LLALFSKLRYDIKVRKDGLDAPWQYTVKITWFARIISFVLGHDKGQVARIFGIKVKMPQMGDDDKGDKSNSGEEAEKPHPTQVRATQTTEKRLTDARKKQKRKKRHKKESRWDKIRNIYEQIGKEHIKEIIAISLAALKKLIKKIMPKKFKLRGKIGTGEPDTTGMALGGVSALSTVLDIHLEGNFEEKDLQLSLHTKGGFRLWTILWLALKFWRNPEIKRLRFILKSNKNKNKIRVRGKGAVYGNRAKPKHG